jgi:prolipoprotein diacylglyceryltransferase
MVWLFNTILLIKIDGHSWICYSLLALSIEQLKYVKAAVKIILKVESHTIFCSSQILYKGHYLLLYLAKKKKKKERKERKKK